MAVITPVFVDGALFGFCGSIAHKSDIGGPVPGSCSGQAREIFNEGLHLPAVRYQRGWRAQRRNRAHHRRQQPHARAGARRHPRPARRRPARRAAARRADRANSAATRSLQLLRPPVRGLPSSKLRAAIAEWADGRFEAERFVDDDGIELEKPVRIHVVVEKQGDALNFDFSGSADQTKGPANVRPPLVQARLRLCADLADRSPHVRVERALARLCDQGARRQRAQPALPGAGQHLQSDRTCAGRCDLRGA